MDKVPFVSIGIASYNYEKYIVRELDSIKQQTFKDYEVVICDDCSQDDSCEVIEGYIAANPQMSIRLIKNEKNQGILYTKQRLLDNAAGQYIMFCDSDDWMAPDCLETLCAKAIEEDADRVIGEVYDIDDNGKILQIQDNPQYPSKWLHTIHHGTIYRRSIFVEHDIRFRYMPDDAYLILKFNQYSKKTVFIDKPIYYWFVNMKSESRNVKRAWPIDRRLAHFKNILGFTNETIDYVKKNYDDPEDDVLHIELFLLKMYYAQIFNGMRFYTLRDKLYAYGKIHKILLEGCPNYLKNKYLKLSEPRKPLRPYAAKIICYSALAEKLHLFRPALVAYHIVSKFVYFDQ